jgi:hypothetical protein
LKGYAGGRRRTNAPIFLRPLDTIIWNNPSVALAAVMPAVALPVFYCESHGVGNCRSLRTHSADLRSHAQGTGKPPAAAGL